MATSRFRLSLSCCCTVLIVLLPGRSYSQPNPDALYNFLYYSTQIDHYMDVFPDFAGPDATLSYYFNISISPFFSMGGTVTNQLIVGRQSLPTPNSAENVTAFAIGLHMGEDALGGAAFFNLESGVFIIDTLAPPAFLPPPAFGSVRASPETRRYLRSLLTMQYYLYEWMFGFNLADTGFGSATSFAFENGRALAQSHVPPYIGTLAGIADYIGQIAAYIAIDEDIIYFDNVPISEEGFRTFGPVYNATNALGFYEYNALYGGRVVDSFVLDQETIDSHQTVQACAEACFQRAQPFLYCPASPFVDLVFGPTCPADGCDAWRLCDDHAGGCAGFPQFWELVDNVFDRQPHGTFPEDNITYEVAQPGAYPAPYQGQPGGGYGGYGYGSYGYGSYGGYGGGPPGDYFINLGSSSPHRVEGYCELLVVGYDALDFEYKDLEALAFSGITRDVRPPNSAANYYGYSGRILPFPTGVQEF